MDIPWWTDEKERSIDLFLDKYHKFLDYIYANYDIILSDAVRNKNSTFIAQIKRFEDDEELTEQFFQKYDHESSFTADNMKERMEENKVDIESWKLLIGVQFNNDDTVRRVSLYRAKDKMNDARELVKKLINLVLPWRNDLGDLWI